MLLNFSLIDLTDAPYENYSIILGISKKDQNQIQIIQFLA